MEPFYEVSTITLIENNREIIDLTQDSDSDSDTPPTQPATPSTLSASQGSGYASTVQFSEMESDSDESDCPTEYENEDHNFIGYTVIYENYFNLESMVFRIGKYRGCSVSQLMNEEKYRYLQWVACQDNFYQPSIVHHIREHVLQHTKLPFGKFSYLTLCEIRTKHPRYWYWLRKWRKSLLFLRYV